MADAAVVHSHDRSAGYELARTYLLHHRLFELFGLRTIPRARDLARAIASTARLHLRCERGAHAAGRKATGVWRALQPRGGLAARAGPWVGFRRRRATSPSAGGPSDADAGRLARFPAARAGRQRDLRARARARALRERGGDEVLVLTREQDPPARSTDVRDETPPRPAGRVGQQHVPRDHQLRGHLPEPGHRARGRADHRGVAPGRRAPAPPHVSVDGDRRDVLATRRIPVVYTLHDYWLLCHRGQRLDTSYQVCEGPGPSGCGGCVDAVAEAPVPGASAGAARGGGPIAKGDWGRRPPDSRGGAPGGHASR